jgi:hypothetical protein
MRLYFLFVHVRVQGDFNLLVRCVRYLKPVGVNDNYFKACLMSPDFCDSKVPGRWPPVGNSNRFSDYFVF